MTLTIRAAAFATATVVGVAAGSAASLPKSYYAQTGAQTISTTSASFVPIPSLSFTISAASAAARYSIITLDMPEVYFVQVPPNSGIPGGTFGICVTAHTAAGLCNAATNIVALGAVTADTTIPSFSGRRTVSITVRVPLIATQQDVVAEWEGVRGAEVASDTFGSLTGLLVSN